MAGPAGDPPATTIECGRAATPIGLVAVPAIMAKVAKASAKVPLRAETSQEARRGKEANLVAVKPRSMSAIWTHR